MRWTEAQIENYLKDETRKLVSSDQQRVTVTLFRMAWITFDAVRVDDRYTEAELVDWAQDRVKAEGITFKVALKSNLGLLDHEIRRQDQLP